MPHWGGQNTPVDWDRRLTSSLQVDWEGVQPKVTFECSENFVPWLWVETRSRGANGFSCIIFAITSHLSILTAFHKRYPSKICKEKRSLQKIIGMRKKWEEGRFLKAFGRGLRKVSGWNDLASSLLSRPGVERSSCPDTVTLGWRDFVQFLVMAFSQMNWSIQVDPENWHEPLLEKRRRPIDQTTGLALWSLESSWVWQIVGIDNGSDEASLAPMLWKCSLLPLSVVSLIWWSRKIWWDALCDLSRK